MLGLARFLFQLLKKVTNICALGVFFSRQISTFSLTICGIFLYQPKSIVFQTSFLKINFTFDSFSYNYGGLNIGSLANLG